MPQSFGSNHQHIIFSTKHREPLIDSEWKDRLYSYIGGILRNKKSTLVHAGGISDHVHLLIHLARDCSVSDCLRDIKSYSSRWVKEELSVSRFQWQDGYAAFAVSKSGLLDVIQYLDSQEEHHKKLTYQEEYRRFLTLHGEKFDERYMWD